MRFLPPCLLVFIAVCSGNTYAYITLNVDVFYIDELSQRHEVKGVMIKYHDLLKAKKIQNSLSLKLPNTLDDASSFMSKFASTADGKQIIQNIVSGYQSVGKSFSLGIRELPAIVINEQYVVYGTTDVLVALDFFKKFKGAEK